MKNGILEPPQLFQLNKRLRVWTAGYRMKRSKWTLRGLTSLMIVIPLRFRISEIQASRHGAWEVKSPLSTLC
jgi:hypothetical protein